MWVGWFGGFAQVLRDMGCHARARWGGVGLERLLCGTRSPRVRSEDVVGMQQSPWLVLSRHVSQLQLQALPGLQARQVNSTQLYSSQPAPPHPIPTVVRAHTGTTATRQALPVEKALPSAGAMRRSPHPPNKALNGAEALSCVRGGALERTKRWGGVAHATPKHPLHLL